MHGWPNMYFPWFLTLVYHQALESYKRAYELDQTNDLVLKICGLMLELPIVPGRAKYWVEVRLLTGF